METESPVEDCGICLCPLEAVAEIPCGHIYHHECIAAWAQTSNACPYCRRPFDRIIVGDRQLPVDDKRPDDDGDEAADDAAEQSGGRSRRRDARLADWTRAWERVRSRAWDRLNGDLPRQTRRVALSSRQIDELDFWRARMENRGFDRRAASMAEPQPDREELDPHVAGLWRAFDQARSHEASHSQDDQPEGSSRPQKRPRLSRVSMSASSTSSSSLVRNSHTSPSRAVPSEEPAAPITESRATLATPTNEPQAVSRPRSIEMPGTSSRLTGVLDRIRAPPPQSPCIIAAYRPSKTQISQVVSAALSPYYPRTLDKDRFATLNRKLTHDLFARRSRLSGPVELADEVDLAVERHLGDVT
ncbi:hypothetical protein PYCC9005_005868 [Savitreella phatthalungensis]